MLNISPARPRQPPLRAIWYGSPGSWKTSTLAHAEKALWLDFHGSTSVLSVQPDCAWDPTLLGARPPLFIDLIDTLRAIAQPAIRARFDTIIFDGLDDIERLYLVPEALRRTGKAALSDDFWGPSRVLMQVHRDLMNEVEKLWQAGYNLHFTCHDQLLERKNPEGFDFQAVDLALFYLSGKVGNVNCPALWRDWVDWCIYLTTTGRSVKRSDKEKVGKAIGDPDKHVAYFAGEAWLDSVKGRRLEELTSPLSIDSSSTLWHTVMDCWRRAFLFDVEELRAEATRMAEAMIASGRIKNADKARQTIADAAGDAKALLALINKLR